MADPQLLRVFYIEALGHSAANRSREALEWVDTALELAIELDDQSALVALLYLRGAENASLLHSSEAVTDFEDSRVLLRGLRLCTVSTRSAIPTGRVTTRYGGPGWCDNASARAIRAGVGQE
jgi:hypothetical protein